jgi:hypothetical protein
MIGWATYFCLGSVSKAYRVIEQHARERLRQWLCAKHKLRGAASKRYPDTTLHGALGLARLRVRTASFPWAKGDFSESRMREIRPVRFDERDVVTEHGEASEAPADERAGTDRLHLHHRATSRLYHLPDGTDTKGKRVGVTRSDTVALGSLPQCVRLSCVSLHQSSRSARNESPPVSTKIGMRLTPLRFLLLRLFTSAA